MHRRIAMGFVVASAFGALPATGADATGASAAAPTATKVSLQVTANGFNNTKGQALFLLYTTPESWLKPPKAFRTLKVAVGGPSVTATFTDLEPGLYAVSVIHDENANGKLDMHWFPLPGPDEGAAVSNDATATVGPPAFNAARFQLGERGGVLNIRVRY